MKVSVNDFELHLMPFMKKIADSMPTSLHKWLGGAMIATSAVQIENFIKSQADADGMVDLDNMRKLVDSGFTSSGGAFEVRREACQRKDHEVRYGSVLRRILTDREFHRHRSAAETSRTFALVVSGKTNAIIITR